jgi:Flp pilus assembly protein CpaB
VSVPDRLAPGARRRLADRHGRARSLVLAAALAAAAAGLLAVRDSGGAAPPAPRASVYVAVADIPAGTPSSDAASRVELRSVPADGVVPQALTDLGRIAGLAAVEPIHAGEQVTLRRFGGGELRGVRAELAGTQRAMQVAGTREQLLAGTLVAGDQVDVVASVELPEGSGRHRTRVVLRGLAVLATAAAAERAVVTLRGSDAQAAALFHVLHTAEWSLVLRPARRAADGAGAAQSSARLLGAVP